MCYFKLTAASDGVTGNVLSAVYISPIIKLWLATIYFILLHFFFISCLSFSLLPMSLPVISPEELSDSKRCFVTLKNRVYDVTQFVPDHPGGADLILNYRGKDVSEMMSDITSHEHSESAYEMLEEYLIGILSTSKPSSLADTESTLVDSKDPKEIYATGLTCEEDLNVPTDINNDFAKHKFLDLSSPLLPQVFNGGFTKEFYLQQVHRPRHYPYGSARLMPYLWMEPFSKTPWWVIPTLWGPCVAYGTWFASQGLSLPVTILFWLTGLFLWTLVEYGLHRFLFHVDQYLPDNKYFLTLHFLLHGVHHYLPTDKYIPFSLSAES